MKKRLDEIRKIVVENGYKFTYSRNIMVKLFLEETGHITPEDIYLKLSRENISLPTVYRNIEIFKQIGVIKEINIDNTRLYELSIYSKKKLHIHFKCSTCKTLKEYDDMFLINALLEQKNYIEEKYQDQMDDMTIIITGKCRECKKGDE